MSSVGGSEGNEHPAGVVRCLCSDIKQTSQFDRTAAANDRMRKGRSRSTEALREWLVSGLCVLARGRRLVVQDNVQQGTMDF
jgi:hypothetical protein